MAAVFAVAGMAKLMDRDGARQAVAAFGVPRRLVAPLATILPVAEIGVALALLLRATAVAGAAGALVLLGLFIVGVTVNLAGGRQPDCRCFGQLHTAPLGVKTLARNVILAGLAALVVAGGPGTGLGAWSSGRSGIEWVSLAVAAALAMAFVVEGSLLVERWRSRRR